MIKVIILDFDGVIIESVNIKTEAFRELFQEYSDNIDEIMRYHLDNNALSRYIKFKHIWENILGKNYTPEVKEQLGRKFSDIVYYKVLECNYVDGATDFLQFFSGEKPMYLVSNTPQKELDQIVENRNLKQFFKHVFGSPPGNKIDFIKKAMERENVKPDEVLYIGDMVEDYNIAEKTGVNFVGRENIESFDHLNIPHFSNLLQIKEWVVNQKA